MVSSLKERLDLVINARATKLKEEEDCLTESEILIVGGRFEEAGQLLRRYD